MQDYMHLSKSAMKGSPKAADLHKEFQTIVMNVIKFAV